MGGTLERWKRIDSVPAVVSKWLRVDRNTYETPAGVVNDYYTLTRDDFVLVVAVEGDSILLVRQYRPATDRIYVSLPAGYINLGETKVSAAKRELKEETGADAISWTYIGELHPLPGYIRSAAHVFQCQVEKIGDPCKQAGRDPIEAATLVRVPRKNVLRMIYSGEIVEMQTVAAVLLAELKQKA